MNRSFCRPARVLVPLALSISFAAGPLPAAGWLPDGTPVVAVAGDQRPAVALQEPDFHLLNSPWGPPPGMWLFWEDERAAAGETDLYRAYVDYQGPPGPPFEGTPVVTASGRQSGLALDRTGGILIPAPPGALSAASSLGADWLLAWRDDGGGGQGGVWMLGLGPGSTMPAGGVRVSEEIPIDGSVVVAGGNTAGGGIAAWIDERSGFARVHAQRVDAAGAIQWAAGGIPVSAASAHASELDICADGAGGAYLTWREEEPLSPPLANHRLVVQYLDPAGSPHAGWPATGIPYGIPSSGAQPASVSPRIIGGSGVTALWRNPDDQTGGGTLFAFRWLADGNASPAWPPGGLALNAVPGAVDFVTLRSGFVAWTDRRSGTSLDVYAQRFADGEIASGWSPDGQPVCTAAGDQVVSDVLAGERLIVGWSDTRHGEANAYVGGLQIDGSPLPGWGDGVRLSSAPGGQTGPLLAWSFGAGIIAAWRDGRNAGSSGQDVYAQTVNRYGEVGVQVNAVPAPAAAALRLHPARPNPSLAQVRFAVDLPAPGRLKAEVLDLSGRRVATLRDGHADAGRVEFRWDGRDPSGVVVAPGLYVLRVESEELAGTRRFIRLR